MAKVEITIDGKSYPCRPTMGAMLRFKRETGKEVTELTGKDLSDLCIYLYCCVASACAADNVSFDYPLMDFADRLDQREVTEWAQLMQGGAEEEEKKS